VDVRRQPGPACGRASDLRRVADRLRLATADAGRPAGPAACACPRRRRGKHAPSRSAPRAPGRAASTGRAPGNRRCAAGRARPAARPAGTALSRQGSAHIPGTPAQ
jgi:hypothetical protein